MYIHVCIVYYMYVLCACTVHCVGSRAQPGDRLLSAAGQEAAQNELQKCQSQCRYIHVHDCTCACCVLNVRVNERCRRKKKQACTCACPPPPLPNPSPPPPLPGGANVCHSGEPGVCSVLCSAVAEATEPHPCTGAVCGGEGVACHGLLPG